MSGARADLISAFHYIAKLQIISKRMETFINTNDLLRQTQLPQIFHKGEAQQKADSFLEMMERKYGSDPQFQYITSQMQPKEVTRPIERQYKSTLIAGWAAKIYNWVRDHELRQLQEDFDTAQQLVSPPLDKVDD